MKMERAGGSEEASDRARVLPLSPLNPTCRSCKTTAAHPPHETMGNSLRGPITLLGVAADSGEGPVE